MTTPSAPSPWPLALGLILVLTLWRLGAAALLPVTQDEAYYFDWARHLAWGYFDHPPGAALLGLGTRLAPGSVLAARLGGLLAGTLTLLVLARLAVHCGLARPGDLALVLVLAFATLPGLAGGLLTTPDTPLVLAWALALHEGERALAGQRRRWLGAGLAVGLGLLSKYNMVLIGPVFLWAILRSDPQALRGPWPYLGGLIALLVFAPNLIWNLQHDWLTMRFQFGHGFAFETGDLAGVAPVAEEPRTWLGRLRSLFGYAAMQFGLWGLLAPVLVAALVARWRPGRGERRGERRGEQVGGSTVAPQARPLLQAAVWFPLGFFALASLSGESEANWPGVYLLAAAVLLAVPLRDLRGWVLAGAAANLLLVSLYVLHARTVLPLPDGLNRVLRETHGFRDLAGVAAGLRAHLYADRYQTIAMLHFYRPDLGIGQWPGLARPSEYSLGRLGPRPDPGALTGPFWLLTRREEPPAIPGFTATVARTLQDCPGVALAEAPMPPCARPLHTWYLYRFETSPAGTTPEPG